MQSMASVLPELVLELRISSKQFCRHLVWCPGTQIETPPERAWLAARSERRPIPRGARHQ